MSVFDRIDEKSKGIAQKNKALEVQTDIKNHITFSFEADEETINYLKSQTVKLNNSMSQAYTEVGKIFSDTQKELSNNKNGVFYSWFQELGFNKNQVYRWINRYEFILSQNETVKNLIENLPVTLTYEISNPNCLKELRDKVLSGEITSLKEFSELKNKMLLDLSEPVATSMEVIEIDDIFNQDFKSLNSKFKDLNKLIKDKIDTIPKEKKEVIVKKVEAITKEIEKLINSL